MLQKPRLRIRLCGDATRAQSWCIKRKETDLSETFQEGRGLKALSLHYFLSGNASCVKSRGFGGWPPFLIPKKKNNSIRRSLDVV